VRNPGRFVTRSMLAAGRPVVHSIDAAPVASPVSGAVVRDQGIGSVGDARPVRGARIGRRVFAATSARVLTVLATVLAVAAGTTAPAFADSGVVRAETATGFGMLGPVGLVAVGFGIVGMALGVVRQRRKARAKAAEAAAGVLEEPTRPLEPLQQP